MSLQTTEQRKHKGQNTSPETVLPSSHMGPGRAFRQAMKAQSRIHTRKWYQVQREKQQKKQARYQQMRRMSLRILQNSANADQKRVDAAKDFLDISPHRDLKFLRECGEREKRRTNKLAQFNHRILVDSGLAAP